MTPEAQHKALLAWVRRKVMCIVELTLAVSPNHQVGEHGLVVNIMGTFKEDNPHWFALSDYAQIQVLKYVIDRLIKAGKLAVVGENKDLHSYFNRPNRYLIKGNVLDELGAAVD